MPMNRNTSVELTNMCMVYDNNGNVLVEEKVGKNYHGLIFPGGHVENRESVVNSMIREIKEETGLTISNLEFCGIKDWVEEDGSRYMVFLYSNICDVQNYTGELRQIIDNGYQLATYIYNNPHFVITPKDPIYWLGNDTQKEDPADIAVGRYMHFQRKSVLLLLPKLLHTS